MASVRRRGALIVLAVVLALAGCAHEPAEQVPLWDHLLRDPPGLEIDPPQTLGELVEDSELVLRGSIAKVRSGPTDRYDSDDPQVPDLELRSAIRDPRGRRHRGAPWRGPKNREGPDLGPY